MKKKIQKKTTIREIELLMAYKKGYHAGLRRINQVPEKTLQHFISIYNKTKNESYTANKKSLF